MAFFQSPTHDVSGNINFLVNKLLDVNEIDGAIETSPGRISEPNIKSSVIKSIISKLIEIGDLNSAEQLISEILEPASFNKAASLITYQFAKTGERADAERLASSMTDPAATALVNGSIARAYYEIRDYQSATVMIEKIYPTIQSITVLETKIDCLLEFASICSGSGYTWNAWPVIREAIHHAISISGNSKKKGALNRIISTMMKTIPVEQVQAFAGTMGASYFRSAIENAVALAVAQSGDIIEARKMYARTEDTQKRIILGTELVNRCILDGKFQEAIDFARETTSQDYFFEKIIPRLLKVGKYTEACSCFEQIQWKLRYERIKGIIRKSCLE